MNKENFDFEIIKNFLSDSQVYLWYADYTTEKRKVFYSDSFFNLTGYLPEQILIKPGRILSIVYQDDLQHIKKKMISFEQNPEIKNASLNFRIVKKNSKTIWVKENLIFYRKNDGTVKTVIGLVTDVSEIKENEEKLKKACLQLNSINSSKDKFISIISHDLRAPFTSLLGFSEILMNESDLPEENRNEYVGYIYEASNSQLQLINYLLDWSRLQTGRLQIEKQVLKVSDLIDGCVASLTGATIKKNITVDVNISSEFEISADLRLINQVLMNLLSNAIKFTPNGKKIDVSVERYNKNEIEIIVKDEGVGISEEKQKDLFKIDKKISTDGTNGEKGTGLGLLLVKEIVEKHKGKIWFYSEENKGTEFHITLPEAQNSILLVEDDPEVLELYLKLLRKAVPNYEIIISENGYEAMSHLLKRLPSIVITDHDMPLMNGLHLAEAVRKKDKDAYIPIIIISGKLTDEVKEKYLKLDVDNFIEKPVAPETFINLVKEMVL